MKDPAPKYERISNQPYHYSIGASKYIGGDMLPINRDFLEVTDQRRSTPILAAASDHKLWNLLCRAANVKAAKVDDFENLLSWRTAPSAGAIHPIDILYSSCAPIDNRVLEYFNPFEKSLNKLNVDASALTSFFENVNSCADISNSSLIWFAIQSEKTSSKYENPESLFWRDAGALLYCIQLFATSLNLTSLPIG